MKMKFKKSIIDIKYPENMPVTFSLRYFIKISTTIIVVKYLLNKYGVVGAIQPPRGYHKKYSPQPTVYKIKYHIKHFFWSIDNWLFNKYGRSISDKWMQQFHDTIDREYVNVWTPSNVPNRSSKTLKNIENISKEHSDIVASNLEEIKKLHKQQGM